MNAPVTINKETILGEPSASLIRVASELKERDLVAVEKNLITTVQSSCDLAEMCCYCRPVGKDNGRQNFAIGPSVRLAEIGQQAFGSLWVNVFTDVDRNAGKIESTAKVLDLRTLNVYYGSSSKSIKGRNGLYSESMIEVTGQASASIARRNALLQAMRPQLEAALVVAKKKAASRWGTTPVEVWNALLGDYNRRWGTTNEQLVELVEDESSTEDRLWLLIGIRNYLIDNDEDSDYFSVFGVNPIRKPKAAAAHSATTQASATSAKKAPAKVTPEQAFATLQLELKAEGKEAEFAQAVAEYEKSEGLMSEKDWKTKDFEDACSILRKILDDKPPA